MKENESDLAASHPERSPIFSAIDAEVLRAALDTVQDAVIVKDAEGRYVFANAAAAALMGRPLEEIIGRAASDLFADRTAEAARLADHAVLEAGSPEVTEEIVAVAGAPHTFLTTKQLLRDADGRTIGLLEVSRDITDRRTAEWAQRAEERALLLDEAGRVLHSSLDFEVTLRAVVQLIVPRFADWCVIHLVDEHGDIRQFEVGHADADTLERARDAQRRYPPRASWDRGVYQVIRTGRPLYLPEVGDELLAAAARDDEHLAMLHALDLRSAIVVPMPVHGHVLGAVTLIASDRQYTPEDLRVAEELGRRAALAIEHARLYQDSQEANQAKAEFLATMSHELRTPLNAIMGYADLLQVRAQDEARRSEHLERIKASAWHLLSIIEEILSFSRLEAGREPVDCEELDAADVVREAVSMMEPAASQKGLRLDVSLPDSPLPLETDGAKLRQILLNLLGNAIKFTEHGMVRIEVEALGDEAVFRVRDTGVGIEESHMDRIFEPFWQVERGMRRRAGGTGLGLTVSRQLADLLGGSLSVESKPGAGSVFTLELPQQAADES